ncbi:hypothetical protein [Streptomyces sp. NPDC057689]|uniref:hypothetical protein n=1 Tax=Streptomyces sp. NPDC057689 TaxID=3346213 RepID=UPI0036BC4B48
MSKNIAARAAMAAGGLALAAAGLFAGAGTAAVGSSGQQISYTDHATPGLRHSIELYGYSWGTHVAVPYSQNDDWTYVTGY